MVAFLLLNLLMVVSSYVTAYRFSAGSGFSGKLISAFLVYISQISVTTLFLGVILKNLGHFPIIILNITISLVLLLTFKRYLEKAIKDFFLECRVSFSYLFKSKDYFLYFLVFLFALQVSLVLVKIYLLPPHVWDVFAYHLHPVGEWIQQNFIPSSISTPVIRLNRNPMSTKLLHFWVVKFLGDITWVELPQFLYGILAALTSYGLMIKISIQKTSALKYAILIYFIPLILLESRTCQDHLALLSTLLMAMFYFIDVFYEKKDDYLLFLGLAFGLVLGTKISGPHIIIVFFVALLLSRGFKVVAVLDFIKRNALRLTLGLMAMVALGGYWYFKDKMIFLSYSATLSRILQLKTVIITIIVVAVALLFRMAWKKSRVTITVQTKKFFKNKKAVTICIFLVVMILGFFLVKNKGLLKTFVLEHKSPAAYLTDKNFYTQYPFLEAIKCDLTKNILVFPFRIKDIGLYTDYTPDFLEQSGFGIQFFGFGLLAYVIMAGLIFRKRYRLDKVGYFFIFPVVLLLTYFCYYYSRANYRLFIFFPVFGIILWAFWVAKWDFHRFYLRCFDVLMIGMVLFNMSVTLFEGNNDVHRWKTILTLDNPQERTSAKFSPLVKGEEWKYIDIYIRSEEPIGYLGHLDSWIFLYFDNKFERRIFHLRSLEGFCLTEVDDARGKWSRLELNTVFKKSLRQRNIHYLHLNPHGARHRKKDTLPVYIDDKDVFRVTGNLYYVKW